MPVRRNLTGPCWEWPMSLACNGYGRVTVRGRTQRAHRAVYEAVRGPIPAGLVIDHLCRNRACVNPWHLEAVTLRENLLRGDTIPARNARKTHCPRGHQYDEHRDALGRRSCKRCAAERHLERKAARAADQA